MPEGLSSSEIGAEIAEHRDRSSESEQEKDRVITIIEATLLAVVAFVAAYSGYQSAKWSTESRLRLSQATAARTEAAGANLDAVETRNFDSSTFDAWYTAYVAHNQEAMTIAARRFRPEFRVAFDAWERSDPEHNSHAPPGPTYMPEYKQPDLDRAKNLTTKADLAYVDGAHAGTNADDYVRVTVYLAVVLFLVAISSHFVLRGARYALVTVGIIMLVVAAATLATLPRAPA